MLGSLLHRPQRRARRAARPSAAYAVETLEHRIVLSAASPRAAAAAAAQADVSADVSLDTPLLEITDIAVNSLQLVDNQLIANANIVGNLLGQEFNLENVDIPLELLNVTEGTDGCPVLSLAVGPLDLNLLGLDIELDDCEGGAVTLDITAIPSGQEGGGLLGDLLCGVANLLNDQGLPLNLDNFLDGLNDVLGDLTDEQLAGVGDLLEGLLNGVLGGATLGGDTLGALHHKPGHTGGPGNAQGQGQGGGSCDILTLEIPQGISLNVLGLDVQTSGICLDIDAERGPGNLLGNLLCGVTHLLDNPSSLNAVFAQVNRLGRLLDRL